MYRNSAIQKPTETRACNTFETCLSKEREERKIIKAVEACNPKLENRCDEKTRKKSSKSRNIGQIVIFETSNGSNPPTRSPTGPKHAKLHKMLKNTCKKPRKEPQNNPRSAQSAQISQNPPKTAQILAQALQNPSQNTPQPSPNLWHIRGSNR